MTNKRSRSAGRRRHFPTEVFLSHAGRDRRFADRLAGVLRRHGIPVWYSRTHIRAAQQWHDQIGAALARCDWFLLVLTPNAVKSKWAKRELLFALSEDRYEDRIVPTLRRDCDMKALSWTLPSFQYVDFRGRLDDGFADLLRTWKIPYSPDT